MAWYAVAQCTANPRALLSAAVLPGEGAHVTGQGGKGEGLSFSKLRQQIPSTFKHGNFDVQL